MLFSVLICLLFCVLPVAFFHWWLQVKYVAEGFQSNKSYTQRKKEYLSKWSWLQRLLLLPLLSPKGRRKFKILGAFYYCHFFIASITIILHVLNEWYSISFWNWRLGMTGILILCLAQAIILTY